MADRAVVVKLIADTGSFQTTMSRSAQSVESVGTAADKAAKVAKSAFDEIKVAGASLLGFAALKSGQDLINLQQSAQVALTSITGSAQAASAAIQQIYQWDQSNPVPFQNALAAGQKLAAFGVSVKDIVPTLQAIADATGASAGGPEKFDQIALALGQIQVKGKLASDEMLQLSEANVPAWQILADTLNTTVADAQKRVTAGAIDADTALTALREGIEKKFPNAAQNMKTTTVGAFQSLTAGIRNASVDVLGPLQDSMKGASLAGQKLIETLGSGLGTTIQGLTPIIGGATSALGGFSTAAGAVPAPVTAMGLAMIGTRLANKQLNDSWLLTKVRASYAADAMRSFGTTIVGLPGKFTTMAGAAAVGRTAMTAMATSARAAGTAIMGAFGGPIGLAIIGATTALSIWGDAQQRDEQRTKDHAAALSSLEDTLDRVTGALTAATTAKITKDFVEDGTVERMQKLGISTKEAEAAAIHGGAAMDTFRQSIANLIVTQEQSMDWYKKMVADGKEAEAQAKAVEIAQAAVLNPKNAQGEIAYPDFAPYLDELVKVDDTQNLVAQGGDNLRTTFTELVGQVALTAGVSDDKLLPALDAAKKSGTSVEDALDGINVRGKQQQEVIAGLASVMSHGTDGMHYLTGAATEAGAALTNVGAGATAAGSGLGNFIRAAAQLPFQKLIAASDQYYAHMIQQQQQLQQSIQSSFTSFIDPLGAWNTASDKVNARTSSTNTPAVKAADAAVKAARKRADSTKKSADAERDAAVKAADQIRDAIVARAKADEQSAKDAQTNAQARVTAAKNEVSDLQKLYDEQDKAASAAKTKAQQTAFDLQAAQLNRQRAAAGLAAADTPTEKANWQSAYNNALKDEAAARKAAGQAETDYNSKIEKSQSTKQKLAQSTKDEHTAEDQLAQAKSDAAAATENATKRQKAADDAYAKAKEQADARYTKSVDAAQTALQKLIDKQDAVRQSAQDMSTGASTSVAGMVKDTQPSFQQWMTQLSQQKQAQDEWAKNLRQLAQKLPSDVVGYLAGLGPGAAGMIAQMNTQSATELGKAVPLLRGAMPQWTAAIVNAITAEVSPASTAALAGMSDDMKTAMINELLAGKLPPDEIMKKYGLALQTAADGSPIFMKIQIDSSGADTYLSTWLTRKADAIKDALTNTTYGSGGGHGGLATGGVMGEGWTWVGEQGPELAYKSGRNVQVYSASQSAAMMPPAPAPSGPTIIINDNSTTINPTAEPSSVARNQRLATAAAIATMG